MNGVLYATNRPDEAACGWWYEGVIRFESSDGSFIRVEGGFDSMEDGPDFPLQDVEVHHWCIEHSSSEVYSFLNREGFVPDRDWVREELQDWLAKDNRYRQFED
jgi:hypothetical protein